MKVAKVDLHQDSLPVYPFSHQLDGFKIVVGFKVGYLKENDFQAGDEVLQAFLIRPGEFCF
jgi:hypothetical protein